MKIDVLQTGMISQQNIPDYQNYTQTLNADIIQETYESSGLDAWQSQQSWQSELQLQQSQPLQNMSSVDQNGMYYIH